ncbi:hypothetical protein [Streptomyces sp. MBT65]|uniref:hypothetical protein n=1 Tax=Streptomyces sp. MBT65 TaxID=1488395 RepID=UPI0027D9EAD1|nr:hypothetical protein [Streptomyces sp. MBT65]
MIVADVQDQIPRQRWNRLQTQDVDIVGEASEPIPDLIVLERGVVPASGNLVPSQLITLVLELDTSEFGTFPDVRPHRYP